MVEQPSKWEAVGKSLRHYRTQGLARVLWALARLEIRRHPVTIVAITGSVGKTTTKECVAAVLENTYATRRTVGNTNCRTGVPSTVLGIGNAIDLARFIGSLPAIFRRLFLSAEQADYLVLEIGARLPGQIPRHLKSIRPRISIVTAIAPAHLETLGSIENVVIEKGSIVAALPEDGVAILSADDPNTRVMARLHKGRVLLFGFDPSADVWMEAPARNGQGLISALHDAEGAVVLTFEHLTNRHHLQAIMAAWCVGLVTNVPRDRMVDALQHYVPRSGRGTLTAGGMGTVIFDDTYNANPVSMKAALETFREMTCERRRLVVLGDMLELGADSERLHYDIGADTVGIADILIGCGKLADAYVRGHRDGGGEAQCQHFRSIEDAHRFLISERCEGDAIMLKGSHGSGLYRLAMWLNREQHTQD